MDLRFRGLSGALVRRFARKCGSRAQERIIIEALMLAYVDGQIDPLAEGDPVAAARGSKGGTARAEALSAETLSAQGRAPFRVRWAGRDDA